MGFQPRLGFTALGAWKQKNGRVLVLDVWIYLNNHHPTRFLGDSTQKIMVLT